ncbi:hypothetical protein M8C21_003185 [Ambrosia artemisiifolia]|uniref:Disease resistance protein At4g27190-like leucine-rich repeats domain-containing protein n=1 Tax=Ambrosia artemisiifolia TaxID=4212 RepID=A0AAD5GEE0_AMBAR|nr:hypothetical protein M8C21_003185 [Ambrosia artemisiifolia]
MSIARQLFLIPANEEWEVDDDNGIMKEQVHDEVPGVDKLVEEITDKLKEGPTLVVLDDVQEGKTITDNEKLFWEKWNEILPKDLNFVSVLISIDRREHDPEISPENVFEIKALPTEGGFKLLNENLEKNISRKIEALGKLFFDKFKGELSARNVLLMAKILNHYCEDVSKVGELFLEKELREEEEIDRLSKFLCNKHMHDVLPIGVLKDLWWKGEHFFRDSGSVHYSELITYWILEGYLGGGSMTKLYQKGHDVLMELIDCGVVKLQEGGYVFIDNKLIKVDDLYQFVDRTPNLGLATVIKSVEQGFGRITHNDGMLKSTPKRQKKKSASEEHDQDLPTNETLLLDGTRFTEAEITDYIKKETKLKVFGLFYPTITMLPSELHEREEIRVFVLRDCEFLDKASRVSMKGLEVLEISGGRSLNRLTSSFFKNLLNLKSLHLSGLQIRSIPQAIYNLENIQWLIVKDCPNLKKLESISKLVKLIVVDLSGNTSLETLDKNFLKFDKLQTLNLSKTLVSTTPLLKNRKELKHLFCRECDDLGRLRGLTSLESLQTIDLAGSKNFEEFHDSSLQSLTSLITLNLSGTAIDHLPSNISKPRELYLERCLKLQKLKCITSFEKLEVLHLSGSSNLDHIEDNFFEKMSRLRVLKLSKTKISKLPSLSNLSNLREFDLSHCSELKVLPSIECATKLEILDASNCIKLEVMESKSFKSMTRLQNIDFSNTKIESFPSLPDSCNLSRLSLKNCGALKALELNVQFPHLEELNLSGVKSLKPNDVEFVKGIHTLRILDLSYTSIKHLPSLSKFTKLTHLSLAGCEFSSEPILDYPPSKIEVLDLSHSSIKTLPNLKDHKNLKKLMLKDCLTPSFEKPNEMLTSTYLEYVEYPNIKVTSTQEEVNDQDRWNICKLSDIDESPVFLNPTQFLSDVDESPVFLNPTQFLHKNLLSTGPYHLCVVPHKVEGETSSDTYPQRHELVFRDLHLQTRRFFTRYNNKKSMQIRGFNQLPKGTEFENIIKQIEFVLLIDYKLKGIPSGFDASMLPNLKGCWIERCNEMDAIFNEKEANEGNPGFNIPLEDLALRNNKNLQTIYQPLENSKNQPFGGFDSLKSLYIDNCRELSGVFSSAWLPKNLEHLEIKYCDKIAKFGGELPQSLQALKIWECPKIKQLEGTFEIPKGLKTLWISGANSLKNFVTKNNEPINLEELKVANCPMLEYVMSSSSRLERINIIDIRSCERMKNVCKDFDNQTTFNLKKLYLEDLPVLKQFGAYIHISRSAMLTPEFTEEI